MVCHRAVESNVQTLDFANDIASSPHLVINPTRVGGRPMTRSAYENVNGSNRKEPTVRWKEDSFESSERVH